MTTSWAAPTYLDAVGRMRDADGGLLQIRCSCGRVTGSDMMVDLRRMPDAARQALGVGDFACDACLGRIFRQGRASRVAFFAALGAPPEALDRARALDRGSAVAAAARRADGSVLGTVDALLVGETTVSELEPIDDATPPL